MKSDTAPPHCLPIVVLCVYQRIKKTRTEGLLSSLITVKNLFGKHPIPNLRILITKSSEFAKFHPLNDICFSICVMSPYIISNAKFEPKP